MVEFDTKYCLRETLVWHLENELNYYKLYTIILLAQERRNSQNFQFIHVFSRLAPKDLSKHLVFLEGTPWSLSALESRLDKGGGAELKSCKSKVWKGWMDGS